LLFKFLSFSLSAIIMKVVILLFVVALAAAAAAAAADASTCADGECDTKDTQALLQSKVSVGVVQSERRTIETVHDIDMQAMGLRDEWLDKENTKIIEGVPVFNYGHAYAGGMTPSLVELADKKEWIVEFPKGTKKNALARFCNATNLKGNAHCGALNDDKNHVAPFVTVHATEHELKGTVKDFSPKPDFIEPDQKVEAEPEIDERENSQEEHSSLLELIKTGAPASWGLDRIDDEVGIDSSYSLPAQFAAAQGEGAHVYVADTGININHEDFEGRAVAAIEVLGGSGNAVVCDGSDPDCGLDKQSHGTHCAGTIGGKIYGVAKKTKLYSVKVLGDNGGGSFGDIAASVNWVVENGNKLLTMPPRM
jgi:hypothetical protein